MITANSLYQPLVISINAAAERIRKRGEEMEVLLDE